MLAEVLRLELNGLATTMGLAIPPWNPHRLSLPLSSYTALRAPISVSKFRFTFWALLYRAIIYSGAPKRNRTFAGPLPKGCATIITIGAKFCWGLSPSHQFTAGYGPVVFP